MGFGEVRPDVTELVRQAQAGSTAAFSELVRIHQDEVYTLAYRLTGDSHNAADVAQEAFVRAWRAIDRFRGDAKFSTWIHRITVNTAWTDRTRRRRRSVCCPTRSKTPGSSGSGHCGQVRHHRVRGGYPFSHRLGDVR